jgi:RimJ/RimL family protein N-acetyltransferase
MTTLKTERLILRHWCEQDLGPFAKLNADPKVMEYFPATLSKAESDHLARRIKNKMDEKGWGMWAVSVPGVAEFIGFIGLNAEDQVSLPAPFTPAVEVGWRIAFEYWGKGYATEGAKAALAYGFETLNLREIVSFTAVQNMRSRRVMERIGMHHNLKDDFEHPKLLEGHPLRKHVLYRLSRREWQTHKHQKQKIEENCNHFHFAPATPSQRPTLHQWFEQKHIKEWMNGVGLQNTLDGLERFFQRKSDTTYWVGYDKDTPFAFLITSFEGKDAMTLDVFICDPSYLGRGLAVPMIREFLTTHFSNMKRVLIDPEATNTRAIHVYQKVGFKITGEFIASWHPVLHYQMELNIEDLSTK